MEKALIRVLACCGALLVVPAALAATSTSSEETFTLFQPTTQPHFYVVTVESTGVPLTAAELTMLRDRVLVWAAPAGWKLAAKGEVAAEVVQLQVTAKGSKDTTRTDAMIWSNAADVYSGDRSLLADEPPLYAVPADDFGYDFEDWGFCYDPFWYGPAIDFQRLCRPRHEHPGHIGHPAIVASRYLNSHPRVTALAPPSAHVLEVAEARRQDFQGGSHWGNAGSHSSGRSWGGASGASHSGGGWSHSGHGGGGGSHGGGGGFHGGGGGGGGHSGGGGGGSSSPTK